MTKKCGNCQNFIKIKGPSWGVWRNGICGVYDYNVHSNSSVEGEFYMEVQKSYRCKKYKGLRYGRLSKEVAIA